MSDNLPPLMQPLCRMPEGLQEEVKAYARAAIEADLVSRDVPATPDVVTVTRDFIRGFRTLVHNYSLRAEPPSYYHGTEGDAFSAAYARCGRDLAEVDKLLAASPQPQPVPANVHEQVVRALAGLLEQVEAFAAKHGEADFETAEALRAVEAAVALESSAQPVQAQPSGWQQISTAPKDGRTVLLGYFNSANKWRTMRGQWMSEDYIAEYWEEPDDVEAGWFETCVEADDPPNCWGTTPTHWMQIPPPPAEQEQKEE